MKNLLHHNIKMFFLFCIIIQHPGVIHAEENMVDLYDYLQDFVLETKQIVVPGYAGAFNASIIQWRDSLLLCFRIRDANMISTFQIGFVWLDKAFNPISNPTLLKICNDPSTFSQNQDPRLITMHDDLYILYSNFIDLGYGPTRRMFIAKINSDNEEFFIEKPVCLHSFYNASKRWEKNWVPFVFEDTILLSYSLTPHRIFHFNHAGECFIKDSTVSAIQWDWGELRGGTPALLDGDTYIAFFHSSKLLTSVQSRGKKITHYVMGAYTFQAKPPFAITHISPCPIVGKEFYGGPAYNTWKPLRVVFPVGLLADENFFWVTYGRQDFEMWVAKIDKKKLYESLIPCSFLQHEKLSPEKHGVLKTLCAPTSISEYEFYHE